MSKRFKSVLSIDSINKNVVDFQYAVRGAQAIRAEQLSVMLKKQNDLPFKQITSCNIGNPQQLQQKPITFFRQVSSCLEYPPLLKSGIFKKDVVERAQELLNAVGGSIGSYSHSQGVPLVRERVARYIEERDGYPANPNDIFLTAGASPAVQAVLNIIINHSDVGVMIPIPQYPLYTATIALFGGKSVKYYLNEEDNWNTDVAELQRSLDEAKRNNLQVRALCVINPGNPTGQCLSEESIRQVIEFCKNNNLVLLADEVYQTNVYEKPFVSFKKVLRSMGSEYDSVELFSFHSISKGMIGECGRRGGYLECTNIDQKVKDMIYKISSVSLCPPVSGQLLLELMINPPKQGDPSFELYHQEINDIYTSLKRRAKALAKAFNSLEGMVCNDAQGAMYLFPRLTLSAKACKEAESRGMQPDEFYAMELLNSTGVCVVAGSGFGQKSGTWHFRSTFLPPEDQMEEFIKSIKDFHANFMNTYA